MIVIGEKLNSSIPSTFKAMKEGDDAIISLIKSQEAAGAKFLGRRKVVTFRAISGCRLSDLVLH